MSTRQAGGRARRAKIARSSRAQQPLLLNAGAGVSGAGALPAHFSGWRQLRVDVDPSTEPDLVASIVDLSAIPDGSVDAVWSAHCIEHLYSHEVPLALKEFRRILTGAGFACIIVPDVQAICDWIAGDRLEEVVYQSAAGPVTAHDMIWGFGPAIAEGHVAMAHRCGFTPSVFLERLNAAGFAEIVLRRRGTLELAALALAQPGESSARRDLLMTSLAL